MEIDSNLKSRKKKFDEDEKDSEGNLFICVNK